MNVVTKELFKKPGVVLVGRGKKITNGINTGRDCVVVGVIKKVPIETLNLKDIIPGKVYLTDYMAGIKGIETDVVETGVIRALDDRTAKYRPAPGGVSIGHYQVTAGTLGMVVRKNGVRYILSNNHVLANENKAQIGDSILQPGVYDNGTATDEIAKLSEFIPVQLSVRRWGWMNKGGNRQQKIKLALRKWTTPIHWVCGIIIILAGVCISWWLAGLLFAAFLIFEIWNELEGEVSQYDFWELILAMFVTVGILLLATGIKFIVEALI